MKKILILFLSVSLWGCTEGFTDLNINPTAPVEVQPELLWRKVLYDHADNMSSAMSVIVATAFLAPSRLVCVAVSRAKPSCMARPRRFM